MSNVTMFSTTTCPYCERAETLLSNKGIAVEKILIDQTPGQFERMVEVTGLRTVPQIFIGDFHVGGFTDLYRLDQSGDLTRLLNR